MVVGRINSSFDAVAFAKRGLSSGKGPSPMAANAGNTAIPDFRRMLSEAGGDDAASAKAVMSRYDLHNIAYSDLVAMAGELRDIGALRKEDYLDFIGPSPEYASLTGERVAGWNAPRDYVALHEQQLAFLRSSGAETRFIEFASYQLALYRHFASLSSR